MNVIANVRERRSASGKTSCLGKMPIYEARLYKFYGQGFPFIARPPSTSGRFK